MLVERLTHRAMSTVAIARNWVETCVVDAAFPRMCAECGRRGSWVCTDCEPSVERFAPPWCDRCGSPLTKQRCSCAMLPPELNQFRAVGTHSGWLRHSILALKYGEESARAKYLGRMLRPLLESLEPWDWIVPVPLHIQRERDRGFNQAELLARAAVDDQDQVVTALIRRTRATPQQVGLNAQLRRLNLQGAFAATEPQLIKGKRIILVDDVMTTGSTLQQCAMVLLEAGAARLAAVTLAVGA